MELKKIEERPKCNYCHHSQNINNRIVYYYRKCEWCGKNLHTKKEWFILNILKLLTKEN